MIRKFLIYGNNQIFLSAIKPAEHVEGYYAIDLLMPLPVYWEIKELIRKAEYLISNGENKTVVNENYISVFQKSAPWAVFERDRDWLYARKKQK